MTTQVRINGVWVDDAERPNNAPQAPPSSFSEPVAMETAESDGYRILEHGEVIKDGDEIFDNFESKWVLCSLTVGLTAGNWSLYRRMIKK